MLTKEEIKLGNYFIYNNDGFSTRIEWAENDWLKLIECVINIEDVIPLRINQQQLEKLGYRKIKWLIGGVEYFTEDDYSNFVIRKNQNGNWQMCAVQGDEIFAFPPILQCVHQLQNLYYSLTDKQLIYKH
jgi:hypothetical protein